MLGHSGWWQAEKARQEEGDHTEPVTAIWPSV
jgi:hypothetical protein